MEEIKNKLDGDGNKLKACMDKHFISDKGINYMEQDTYDKFIEERQKTIKEKLVSLIKQ